MLVPLHKTHPPPPLSLGEKYILYPLSRVLVTIGVYKNSPFSDFSPEIFPRQTPQNAPFPVKIETHGSLYIRIGGPGSSHISFWPRPLREEIYFPSLITTRVGIEDYLMSWRVRIVSYNPPPPPPTNNLYDSPCLYAGVHYHGQSKSHAPIYIHEVPVP